MSVQAQSVAATFPVSDMAAQPKGSALNGSNEKDPNIILPPPDIRQIIDKTADFVARNGTAFEDKIRESGQNSQKFAFLNTYDPYHHYYEQKILEFKIVHQQNLRAGFSGGTTPAHPASVGTAGPQQTKSSKSVPTEPPELAFTYPSRSVSAVDLDIIKLTAQYTAVLGRNFANDLAYREARNFQFDFLKPNHALYELYTRFVDQYCSALTAPEPIQSRVHQIAEDRFFLLEAAKKRAEWQKYQQSLEIEKKEKLNKEALQFAQIDWHDFVIAETVLFTAADESSRLPLPTNLAELQHASLEQKTLLGNYGDPNFAIEEAPPDYEEIRPNLHSPAVSTSQAPASDQQQRPQIPETAAKATTDVQRISEEEAAIKERMAQEEKKRQAKLLAQQPGQINIKTNYIPRASAKAKNKIKQVCPRCGQAIPADEMEEHLRIEMLDPRWKEQRKVEEERRATSNLSSADVAANIKRLASVRSDIFDTSGAPTGDEESKRRRRE